MNEEHIRNAIRSWDFIPQIIKHISENPELCRLVLRVAIDESEPMNWRAMYLIDKLHDQSPETVIPLLPQLTDFLKITSNSSKKRHILKLLSAHDIPENETVALMDLCIDHFTSAKEPVAVRVYAMQILYNIAEKETGFANELAEIIHHEIELHGSAGIKARGKKLLVKLSKLNS